MKVLLEMRPALDGHAGIPQETRLLFRGLGLINDVSVEGLIQSSGMLLAKGLPSKQREWTKPLSADEQINRLSRVVISLQHQLNVRPNFVEKIGMRVDEILAPTSMIVSHLFGGSQELTKFDTTHFRDFIWRSLFSKTLPFTDFEAVTSANFRVARLPWTTMNICALTTRLLGHALYPRIDTSDFDVMISETPYPAKVSKRTRLVVRYHDAIPLLMPHTISDKKYHQASHYYSLRNNVNNGAYFACVSEATRQDLISVFPQAEARSVTIHNMVSHHYFPEDSAPVRIPEIIRTRLHANIRTKMHDFNDLDNAANSYGMEPLDYLLVVSTIEPRKNHMTLLTAWEELRAEKFPHLKLVVVGMLGWDHKAIVDKFQPWIERTHLYLLEDVPSPELRLLYRHARATVCPSFGEGFDFSGVEAMRCGGAVAASDIAVHRDIYGDAAHYFSPYSAGEAAQAIAAVIERSTPELRTKLIRNGATVSARYLPENILPQWQQFLTSLVQP